MVRKITVIFFAIIAAVMLAVPASAASLYDGNISTTYITIFRDIVSNIDIDDDYVFYRSEQYQYAMFVGDLTLNNANFSGSDGKLYTITTNSGYNNNNYQFDVTDTNNFSLSCGNALVYSNLGSYPDLIERINDYEVTTVFLLAVGLCCYLLRSILGFCLRGKL